MNRGTDEGVACVVQHGHSTAVDRLWGSRGAAVEQS